MAMDVEAWIIAELEPMRPDAPGEVTMDGPGGLSVHLEVVWWEAGSPDAACRGVNVEVSIGAGPVDSFAYAVAQSGRRALLDRIEPEQAARIATVIQGHPAARLVPHARP
jgi:hypothetical protein